MEARDDRKLIRYSIAVAITVAAVLFRIAITPHIGPRSLFFSSYPAVAFATLLCGIGPGAVAVVLSLLLAMVEHLTVASSVPSSHEEFYAQAVIFSLLGAVTVWMASGRFPIRPFIEGPMGNPETRARRSEEALEAQKELFNAAQRISGVGVWQWDFQTSEITWSEGIWNLLRIKPGNEPTEAVWKRVVDPKDFDESTKAIMRAISERKKEHYFELGITRGDGTRCFLVTRGEIEYDSHGKALRIVGVNFDVSERKEAELKIAKLNKELAKRVSELQAIFDIAPVGIAVALDRSCDVIIPNTALASMIGAEPASNISPNVPSETGDRPKFYKSGRLLGAWDLPMQKAIAEKRLIFDEELEVFRADGKRISMLCSAVPIFDEDGDVVSCVSAQTDITEQKRVIRELEEGIESEKILREDAETLNRIKDEFLAMVSHELRTPLNAIIGWSSLLIADNASDEVKERGLKSIELSARAQSMMIDDLLDVSRIIAGKLRIGRYYLDLIPLVTAAIETLRPGAIEKDIDLVVDLDANVGKISGDAERIQQIVWNLVSNAIKFTPTGGRVEVSLGVVNSFAELKVKDTGCGIKSDFVPFVFDRFRQEDGSLTRRFTGLGLGLSITKSLVELHGGSITAESAGPEHGSTFTVRLPIVPEAIAGANSGRLPKHGRDTGKLVGTELNGASILVVDDDPDSREVVKIFLEQYGSVVETAENAHVAFEKFKANGFRVIISDIGMPEEDGYALVRRIREWEGESSHIPAVALTAYARSEDRAMAFDAGFDEHVAKPVEPDVLIATVAKVLRAR